MQDASSPSCLRRDKTLPTGAEGSGPGRDVNCQPSVLLNIVPKLSTRGALPPLAHVRIFMASLDTGLTVTAAGQPVPGSHPQESKLEAISANSTCVSGETSVVRM
jgi:hypothetical protein